MRTFIDKSEVWIRIYFFNTFITVLDSYYIDWNWRLHGEDDFAEVSKKS